VTTPPVSLVVTVLNEATSLDPLLASLAAQTLLPDEIILVDGGSTDGTIVLAESWRERLPLRIIQRPGTNISAGRNTGIAAARCTIVAVTDAGVRLVPDWLAQLAAPFAADPSPDVVAGFFLPDPKTPFEVAMGATVLPALDDIDPSTFLPSSRSIAFRRAAWERAGGYPEWLDFCEDLIFDLRLRDSGPPFAFAPRAIAYFRPRGSAHAFWHQYFRYARGDGKAALFAKRHAIRYATYIGLLAFLLGGWRYRLLWLLLIPAAGAYVRRPYARLLPTLSTLQPRDQARALLLVPLLRAIGDIAKMAGYPVGLWWRWRRYGLRRDWRTIER
jgi:glycosyltransferase involved in cell wall biosynthesis